MNKKGFTLIELLAVIVILAVVMLIGVTAVLPLIAKAQKSSLASEGLALIDTGKVAYNGEQLATSELTLTPTQSYCFSLEWLRNHNYYEKASDKYSGSVLIVYNESGKYDYYFWITNGTYHVAAGTADNYEVEDGPGDEGIYNCGGFSIDQGPREMQCDVLEGYGYLPVPSGYNIDDCHCTYNGIGKETIYSVYGICTKNTGNSTNVAIITPFNIGRTTTTENFNSCEVYSSYSSSYPAWGPNDYGDWVAESDYFFLVWPNSIYRFEKESWVDWPSRDFNCTDGYGCDWINYYNNAY